MLATLFVLGFLVVYGIACLVDCTKKPAPPKTREEIEDCMRRSIGKSKKEARDIWRGKK